MLYHVSEEPGIARFDPRPATGVEWPVVWAIGDERLHNYLLPRDCPRVTFFAGPRTSPTTRNDGSATREPSSRSNRRGSIAPAARDCSATRCRPRRSRSSPARPPIFIAANRSCRRALRSSTTAAAIVARGVEFRPVESLWPLHDAVASSTLSYSIIRMRNAAPRGR